MLFRNTREKVQSVIEPKIQGARLLDEMSKEYALDFFLFFSSISGITGNAGQTDYAYANHFMDAFAKVRNQWVEEGRRPVTRIWFLGACSYTQFRGYGLLRT